MDMEAVGIRPLKIYVAGPYTDVDPAKCLQNVEAAMKAGLAIWKKGHTPYIPHTTHWIGKYADENNIPMDYEDWMNFGLDWLESCNGLLYLGSSPGADVELSFAKRIGLYIYHSLDEIPEVVYD